MNILLIDPQSSTTYPPLGLMKIATYHKLKHDNVHYVVGNDKWACNQFWDKIYITSVFTYDLRQVVGTIKYYSKNFFNFNNIQVGGVAATLMPDYIKKSTGIQPYLGLLNKPDDFLKELSQSDTRFEYLSNCEYSIDNLPPDYSIIPKETKYKKIIDNAFLLYATKGCPNKCDFCAVSKLEPQYVNYIPIKPRLQYMKENFGDKHGLIFLDNNIAASDNYEDILNEIIDCGFGKSDVYEYKKNGRNIRKKRFVDFNQGVDARLMTSKKMDLMSKIAINPLRLAFDKIAYSEIYKEKVEMAIKFGIEDISNYMLYNFKDSPSDLYMRMSINTSIKEKHPNIRIFSFPMRYSPVNRLDRKHEGTHWKLRRVRAFQLILNATHGIVSHKKKYFNRAFGENVERFNRLLLMPYSYIINRDLYEKKIGGCFLLWNYIYDLLTLEEKDIFEKFIEGTPIDNDELTENLIELMSLYEGEHNAVIPKDEWDIVEQQFYEKYAPLISKYNAKVHCSELICS